MGVRMNDGSISEELHNFFGAYFHQDWDLEAEDWQGIVDLYVDDVPKAGWLKTLAHEIDVLRSTRTGVDLEHFLLRTVGLDYVPESGAFDEWLGDVAHRLRQHADGIERNNAAKHNQHQ